jgi:hypothetical protein
MALITYNQGQMDYMEEQIEEGGNLNFGEPEELIDNLNSQFFTGNISVRISGNVGYVYNNELRTIQTIVSVRVVGIPFQKFCSTTLVPEISFNVYLVKNVFGSTPVFQLYGRMRWMRSTVGGTSDITYNGPDFPTNSEIYFEPFMYLLR